MPRFGHRLKYTVVALFAVALVSFGLLTAFVFTSPASADCSSSACYDCVGFTCASDTGAGHCACDSGGVVNGGKYCVAGGGICYIVP